MSWLEREIEEQPEALARLLEREAGAAAAVAGLLGREDVTSVVLAARGSSDNAARYGQYLFGVRHRLLVGLAAPSLFTRYRTPPRLDGALVAGISQSGRSPDIVAVLAEARRQGRPTVAITNDAASPLAREAEVVLGLQAGAERSVAATKTYVCSLGALALVSASLAGDADALGRAPGWLGQALAAARGGVDAGWLAGAGRCLVVARGFNYATAHEIALKLKELTGIVAEPFSSADVRHGPIGAVTTGFPVLLVAPSGVVAEDVAALVGPLRARGARVLAVSDLPEVLAGADAACGLPAGVPEWVSPLVAVAPGQVLAARVAAALGVDVDQPGGLTKVTETR